jgi:hypothetical protein
LAACGGRKPILDHIVESTKKRVIKNLHMVGRRDDQAMRLVTLDHLQKAVQHSPNLTHIVGQSSLRTNGIEFVEEVNAPHSLMASKIWRSLAAVSP